MRKIRISLFALAILAALACAVLFSYGFVLLEGAACLVPLVGMSLAMLCGYFLTRGLEGKWPLYIKSLSAGLAVWVVLSLVQLPSQHEGAERFLERGRSCESLAVNVLLAPVMERLPGYLRFLDVVADDVCRMTRLAKVMREAPQEVCPEYQSTGRLSCLKKLLSRLPQEANLTVAGYTMAVAVVAAAASLDGKDRIATLKRQSEKEELNWNIGVEMIEAMLPTYQAILKPLTVREACGENSSASEQQVSRLIDESLSKAISSGSKKTWTEVMQKFEAHPFYQSKERTTEQQAYFDRYQAVKQEFLKLSASH